jgi:hypothetical protein
MCIASTVEARIFDRKRLRGTRLSRLRRELEAVTAWKQFGGTSKTCSPFRPLIQISVSWDVSPIAARFQLFRLYCWRRAPALKTLQQPKATLDNPERRKFPCMRRTRTTCPYRPVLGLSFSNAPSDLIFRVGCAVAFSGQFRTVGLHTVNASLCARMKR